jgi:phosphoribosyl 1,2-cyclic phosphate phosphodiesterase
MFRNVENRFLVNRLNRLDRSSIGDTRIRPFRLAEDYVYAFELSQQGRRLFLAMDELNGWTPPDEVKGCDLAVLPMGICEHHPLTGERLIDVEHPVLQYEATFAETLEIVAGLEAARVVLHHIEEMDELTYDDLCLVQGRLQEEGRELTFAWDGLIADV